MLLTNLLTSNTVISSFGEDVVQAFKGAEPCARVAFRVEKDLRNEFGKRFIESRCIIGDLDADEVKGAIRERLGLPIRGVNATIDIKQYCDCFDTCGCGMQRQRHVVVKLCAISSV